MIFNEMFSDPLCRHIKPSGGSGFNQSGEHDFQWDVLKSSL